MQIVTQQIWDSAYLASSYTVPLLWAVRQRLEVICSCLILVLTLNDRFRFQV